MEQGPKNYSQGLTKRVFFILLFSPKAKLSQKAIYGGALMFLFRIIEILLLIVKIVILARLLNPRDFGLLGIGTIAISLLDTFTVLGFNDALIQHRDKIHKFLDTAWTVSVTRGVVLFSILYFCSGLIAEFFKTPDSEPILKIMAILMLFSGFTNIGIIYFDRDLEFQKKFIYQLSGTLADIFIAVSLVFIFRNAWALVFGLLSKGIIRFVLSYVLHPYRPRLNFNAGYAKELFKFGRWVFWSTVISFLALQGDDIFLGKMLGASMLGFYQIAFYLSNIPALEVTHTISNIAFPAYSKLQDDFIRLREGYLMTIRFIGFISIPLSAGIFFMADKLIRIFLGERWIAIIPVVKILAISGLIRSIIGISGSLFYAVGQPRKDFEIHAIRVLCMALAIYPLTRYLGMPGTAISVLIGIIASIPIWLKATFKITKTTLIDYFNNLLPSAIATIFMILVILFINRIIVISSMLALCSVISLSLSVYLGLIFLFWIIFKYGPVKDLQFLLRSL